MAFKKPQAGPPKRNFVYRPRTAEGYSKRAEGGGRDFDTYILDTVKMFKPTDGDNAIRVLPPTWEGAEHFGLDIHVHFQVGADAQAYLCPAKMKNERCPICEERDRAMAHGDQEYADKLKPNRRVLVYLVNRNEEKDGPIVWSMPWTIDRDICKLVVDKRTGEILPIDDPDNGFDIFFERKGKGERTEYIGIAIDRRPSPLGDDRWLEFVMSNPLPTLLNFYPYEHIAKVFGGAAAAGKEDAAPTRRGVSKPAEEETADIGGLPSWEDLESMSFEEMMQMVEENQTLFDFKPEEIPEETTDNEVREEIAKQLGIPTPAPAPAPSPRRRVVAETAAKPAEQEAGSSRMDAMRRRFER